MPSTSGARSTPRTARRVPTASIRDCHCWYSAVAVETVWVGAPPALMNFLIIRALNAWNPKIPPNTTPTAISMISIRLVIGLSSSFVSFVCQKGAV